jgi:cell division protease FtsH
MVDKETPLSERFRLRAARVGVGTADVFHDLSGVFGRTANRIARLSASIAPSIRSSEEKELIYYHEAGHAVVAAKADEKFLLQMMEMIGGEGLGGKVRFKTPALSLMSKSELTKVIAFMFGGMASEEIKYGAGKFTIGSKNDIKEATEIARHMVDDFGMSPLGLINIDHPQRVSFSLLGISFPLPFVLQSQPEHSEKFKEQREEYIREIIDDGKKTALDTVAQNWHAVERLVAIAPTRQILSGPEMMDIINQAPQDNLTNMP